MSTTFIFCLIAIFVLLIAIAAVVVIQARSDTVGLLGALAIVIAASVAYAAVGHIIGLSKPIGMMPGWGVPDLSGDGAKVIGGSVDGDTAYLLLDDGTRVPRLYSMPMTDDMRRAIKGAMQSQAEHQNGNPWGFRMTAKGVHGEKGQGGHGNKTGDQSKGDGDGGEQVEGDLPYAFGPAQPKTYHDKDSAIEK